MGRGRSSQGDEDNTAYALLNPETMILGKSVGTQYHKLTKKEMPSHSHTIVGSSSAESGGGYSPDFFESAKCDKNSSCSNGSAGEDNAHYNISPALVLIYAIRILK